jgi:hypothetical protein
MTIQKVHLVILEEKIIDKRILDQNNKEIKAL